MSKHLRLSEKWFNRGLWGVSFLFAWALIGLGNSIISDLPKVEKPLYLKDFYEQPLMDTLNEKKETLTNEEVILANERERLVIKKNEAYLRYNTEMESHQSYLTTGRVTETAKNDPHLLNKVKELEALRLAKAEVDKELLAIDESRRLLKLEMGENSEAIKKGGDEARERYQKAYQWMTLRVFLYRLAITLPFLLIAGVLYKKQRKSRYWPFVWGFIFFALFAFFVELVPYLPSYGGYVRYGVGALLILVGGSYLIKALNNYLERKRAEEEAPEANRRHALRYELVFTRLSKGVCPSCERKIDTQADTSDFCPHCGLHLFEKCENCKTRKSTFTPFCQSCGVKSTTTSNELNVPNPPSSNPPLPKTS